METYVCSISATLCAFRCCGAAICCCRNRVGIAPVVQYVAPWARFPRKHSRVMFTLTHPASNCLFERLKLDNELLSSER